MRGMVARSAFRRSVVDGRMAVMPGGIPPVAGRHSPSIGPIAPGRERNPPYGVGVVPPGGEGMAVHGAPGVPPVPVPVIEEVEDEGSVEVPFFVFQHQSRKGVTPENEGPPSVRPAAVPGVVMVGQHGPGHGVASCGAPLVPVGRLERILGIAPVAPVEAQTGKEFHLRVSVFRFRQDLREGKLVSRSCSGE